MAAQSRLEGATLMEPQTTHSEMKAALRDDPRTFGFFQAVRLLERLFPERKSVGGFGDPADEVARFDVAPFISFPASEIHYLEISGDEPARMTVNFMGLTGPLGVLPFYYTLQVADRMAARDSALKAFLDIFHHRIVSLFYQAWEKSHFVAGYGKGGRDRITEHLLDLIGLGLQSHQNRMAVPDETLVFYAGLLAPQQRSAVGLEQLLEDYFSVPVEIEQFVGGWYPLTTDTQCSIGEIGHSACLGKGAVAGDEIWDQQARVRIRIGPLTKKRYEEFLPTGSAYEPLRALTRFYCNDQFDFEVQLVLAKDEVPGCVVGADEEHDSPLGWSTWIRSAPFARDADEAVLTL